MSHQALLSDLGLFTLLPQPASDRIVIPMEIGTQARKSARGALSRVPCGLVIPAQAGIQQVSRALR